MKNTKFLIYFILTLTCSCAEVDWKDLLDRPVVISMKRHLQRYNETKKLMTRAGFTNILRFDAIDGSQTSDKFFQTLNIYKGNKGQKGCAASHLLLWKSFLEDLTEKEYLFVCEDDMLPHTDFYSLFPIYWEETPKDFDIVMVGNWLKSSVSDELIVQIPTLTTHAYIISKEGARKLLYLYKEKKKIDMIDNFIRDMMKENEIVYYCYNGKSFPDHQNLQKGIVRFGTGICFQNKSIPSIIAKSRR